MKADVLRYLGYEGQAIDSKTQDALDKGIAYTESLLGRCVYKILDRPDEAMKVLETSSISLERILQGSEKVVIFAGTLGIDFEKTLKKWQLKSTSDGMILNACGSGRIEAVIETMVKDIEEKEDLYAGPRYSPGYGDLSLKVQKNILSYLEAQKKIGIVMNESFVMLPSKSITGIFGLSKETSKNFYEICDDCLLRTTCDQKKCRRKI